jgi:hypothetical protein
MRREGFGAWAACHDEEGSGGVACSKMKPRAFFRRLCSVMRREPGRRRRLSRSPASQDAETRNGKGNVMTAEKFFDIRDDNITGMNRGIESGAAGVFCSADLRQRHSRWC